MPRATWVVACLAACAGAPNAVHETHAPADIAAAGVARAKAEGFDAVIVDTAGRVEKFTNKFKRATKAK